VASVSVQLKRRCMFIVFQAAAARQRCIAALATFAAREAASQQARFACLDARHYYVRVPRSLHARSTITPAW
jgi:hypothetical protein